MIEFVISHDGTLELRQRDIPPTVYLDHWALRRFSESKELGQRLTNAILFHRGTLDEKTASSLAHDLPPRTQTPDLLRVFSEMKPATLDLFTTHDLFAIAQKLELAQRLDRLADAVAERILDLRDTLGVDRSFRRTVVPSGPQIQRGTRHLLREMLRAIITDKQTKITRNHAIDLLHAVVPVAYCEFVLLDKHWETQVDRVRRRFDATPMPVPMAKTFSCKRNGIGRFLCELEAG